MFNKFIILPLFFLMLTCWPTPISAKQGNQMLGHDELKKIFTVIALKNSVWPEQDLRVTHFSSQPTSVTLPAGELKFRLKNQIQPNRLGRKSISVVLLVDGLKTAKVWLTGDLHLFGNVVCARRDLDRKTILSMNDLKIEYRAISQLGDNLVLDPAVAVGKQLKRSLKAGALLLDRLLKEAVIVKRGDLVTILAESENLRITAPGEAKTAGSKGEVIKVKNLMSRKLIFARVKSSSMVTIHN